MNVIGIFWGLLIFAILPAVVVSRYSFDLEKTTPERVVYIGCLLWLSLPVSFVLSAAALSAQTLLTWIYPVYLALGVFAIIAGVIGGLISWMKKQKVGGRVATVKAYKFGLYAGYLILCCPACICLLFLID